MTNNEKASNIAFLACELFPKAESKYFKEHEGTFTMYSYSRFSSLIIQGIAQQMLDNGCSEEQIKAILASKDIRWGLDADEDMLIEWGKNFAERHNFKDQHYEGK